MRRNEKILSFGEALRGSELLLVSLWTGQRLIPRGRGELLDGLSRGLRLLKGPTSWHGLASAQKGLKRIKKN